MGARWYINGCMGDNHDDIWYIDDIYIWLYAIYGIVMVIIHDCHLWFDISDKYGVYGRGNILQ